MVKLGKQTESSYSKVYVCVHQLMGFLRKRGERKMYLWGLEKQLSSCYSGTPNASVLWASIVFRTAESNVLPFLQYLAIH